MCDDKIISSIVLNRNIPSPIYDLYKIFKVIFQGHHTVPLARLIGSRHQIYRMPGTITIGMGNDNTHNI